MSYSFYTNLIHIMYRSINSPNSSPEVTLTLFVMYAHNYCCTSQSYFVSFYASRFSAHASDALSDNNQLLRLNPTLWLPTDHSFSLHIIHGHNVYRVPSNAQCPIIRLPSFHYAISPTAGLICQTFDTVPVIADFNTTLIPILHRIISCIHKLHFSTHHTTRRIDHSFCVHFHRLSFCITLGVSLTFIVRLCSLSSTHRLASHSFPTLNRIASSIGPNPTQAVYTATTHCQYHY